MLTPVSRAAASQALPLSPDVKKINPHGVAALAKDVRHLTDFVDGLENGFMLRSNLDELEQTIQLLQSDNTDEFFDISTRNKKYGRVDAMNGPILLEKYVFSLSFLSSLLRSSLIPSCILRALHCTAQTEYVDIIANDLSLILSRLTHHVSTTGQAAQRFANFSSNLSSRFK